MKKRIIASKALFCAGLVCPAISSVVAIASCSQNNSEYTITWKNYDGQILKTTKAKGNTLPVFDGKMPTKPMIKAEEYYLFSGWEPALSPAVSDATYTAKFVDITKGKDTDFDGLPDSVDPMPNSNIYPNVKFATIDEYTDNIQINYNWFFGDNTKYNANLSKLQILHSCRQIGFDDNYFKPSDYENSKYAMFSRLGCGDVQIITLNPNDYENDKNDLTIVSMAHHIMTKDDGTKQDIIFANIRGTTTAREWASNVDLGSEDPSYETTTGSHPEWENKNFHKGFYIAASRVLRSENHGAGLIKYVEEHSKNGKPIVFISGHSRGGAIAEIIGWYFEKKFIDEQGALKCKPFTYTTGSPAVINKSKLSEELYQTHTIFNIINDDDAVPKLVHSKWNMTRLGVDAKGKDAVNYSIYDGHKDEFKQFTKKDYFCFPGIDDILGNLPYDSRNLIYKVEKNNDNLLSLSSRLPSFETQEKCEEYWTSTCLTGIAKLKISDAYFTHEVIKNAEGKYNLQIYSCLGAIADVVMKLITNFYQPGEISDVLNNIFYTVTSSESNFFFALLECIINYDLFSNLRGAGLYPHDLGSHLFIANKYITK